MTRSPSDYCAECKTKVPPAKDGLCPYCAGALSVAPVPSASPPASNAREAPAAPPLSTRPRPLALTGAYFVLSFMVAPRSVAFLTDMNPTALVGVAFLVAALVLLSERSPKGILLASFASVGTFILSMISLFAVLSSLRPSMALVVINTCYGIAALSVVFLLHTPKVREEFPDY